MFTQCPKCDTAFRLTAAQLEQAGGNVRCGSCSHIFNALEVIEEQQAEQQAQPDNAQAPEWLAGKAEESAPQEDLARDDDGFTETTTAFSDDVFGENAGDETSEPEETDTDPGTDAETNLENELEDEIAEAIESAPDFPPARFTPANDEQAEPEADADDDFEDNLDDDLDEDDDEPVFAIEQDAEPETPNDGTEADEATASEDNTEEVIEEERFGDTLVYDDSDDAAGDEADTDSEETGSDDEPEDADQSAADDEPAETENDSEPADKSPADDYAGEDQTDDDTQDDLGDLEDLIEEESEDSPQPAVSTQPELPDPNDNLEFNVPKQKWGSFFSGGYDGPVIEPVGPLHEHEEASGEDAPETDESADQQGHETTVVNPDVEDDSSDDETAEEDQTPEDSDETDGEPSTDEPADLSSVNDDDPGDLEGLLEEESEALQTYSDLNEKLDEDDSEDDEPEEEYEGADDEDHESDEPDEDEADQDDTAPEESDEAQETDSNELRNAIDTLTMHQAEWKRLLDAADDDGPAFVVADDESDTPDAADSADDEATDATTDDLADTIAADDDSEDDSDDDSGDDSEDDSTDESSEDEAEHDEQDSDDESAEPVEEPEEREHRITEADLGEKPLWMNDDAPQEDKPKSRFWMIAAGLLLLATGLTTQLIHHNRETLAVSPQYGEQIRKVYALIDQPLYPAWSLSAYEVRGYEAVYGENGTSSLNIRAQVAITGDQPVGEPMVRVQLNDRWGNSVGKWLFSPDQYTEGMRPPSGLIQPGTLINMNLVIANPGQEAQGSQIEICLRREGGVLQCDNDS